MDERETMMLMDDISVVMKALVAQATSPLLARIDAQQAEIDALKSKHVDPADLDSRLKTFSALMKEDRDAASAEGKEIATLKAEVAALKAMPAPKDGKDADPSAVAALVTAGFAPDMQTLRTELATLKDAAASMGAAIAAHGNAIEGAVKSSDVDARIIKAVAAIPPAPELPDVAAMIAEAIEAAKPEPIDVKALIIEAVDAIPKPKDGAPGPKGETGAIGPAGLNGKDGADLIGTLMIDRKGALIHTLADGSMRDLGIVVGKDVDMTAVEGMIDTATHKQIAEAWAAIPEPKDGEPGPQGEPGKSITVEDVAPLIETAVAKHVESIKQTVPDVVKSAVAAIPIPQAPQLPDIGAMVTEAVMALPPAQDGKDADPALVQSLVKEAVERAVAALPVAKDGKSVTIDDVRPLIEAEVTKAVTLITVKDGVDGKDGVTLEELVPVIEDRVQKASAAIQVPKDGKDGATVEELLPHINDTIAKAVSALPLPKDGKDGRDAIDVKDLLVVEGGDLVATFTDGRVKVLGPFRGKDGAPGEPGKDGRDIDPQVVEKLIDEKIAKVAPPEIERDAYLADVSRMIEEAAAKHAPVEEEEFAPDEVAANIALAVKMMAERPAPRVIEPEQKAQPSPTINFAFSDNREPTVVNVAPPSINIEAKRGKEVTKVTGYDENGRIKSFEKTEVDE